MRRRPAFLPSLICVLAAHTALAEDSASTARLKAALVYNVIKFVSFPTTEGSELKFCVFNDSDDVTQAMYALQGRTAQNLRISVQRLHDNDDLSRCQIAFLSSADENQYRNLLTQMRGKAVLSISDLNMFAENGGVIGLYTEGDKLKLKINIDAAKRATLTVAAPLLNLAQVIREGSN